MGRSCPAPKGTNQRTLWERERGWGGRLGSSPGHGISQWGTNDICAGDVLPCEKHCSVVSTLRPASHTPVSVTVESSLRAR